MPAYVVRPLPTFFLPTAHVVSVAVSFGVSNPLDDAWCSFHFLIHSTHGDSAFHPGQQVVRGQTATRSEVKTSFFLRCSTWQGRGIPPSIASFPSAASGGNGNPAGFRAFPPAIRRSIP